MTKDDAGCILSDFTKKELPWGNLTGIRPTKISYAMLEEEKSMMGTDEYIEEKARERLGYVKSDETVFVRNE